MPSILRVPYLVFMVIAFPVISLAGNLPAVSATNERTVVAAGFGFQDESVSFITVKSYFSFATRLMFVTGIVFETPFVVMGLAKIGLVTSRSLLRWGGMGGVGCRGVGGLGA